MLCEGVGIHNDACLIVCDQQPRLEMVGTLAPVPHFATGR